MPPFDKHEDVPIYLPVSSLIYSLYFRDILTFPFYQAITVYNRHPILVLRQVFRDVLRGLKSQNNSGPGLLTEIGQIGTRSLIRVAKV